MAPKSDKKSAPQPTPSRLTPSASMTQGIADEKRTVKEKFSSFPPDPLAAKIDPRTGKPMRRRPEPTMLVRQLSGGYKIVAGDPETGAEAEVDPNDPHAWKRVQHETDAEKKEREAAEAELMDEKETDAERAERLQRQAEEAMRKSWSENSDKPDAVEPQAEGADLIAWLEERVDAHPFLMLIFISGVHAKAELEWAAKIDSTLVRNLRSRGGRTYLVSSESATKLNAWKAEAKLSVNVISDVQSNIARKNLIAVVPQEESRGGKGPGGDELDFPAGESQCGLLVFSQEKGLVYQWITRAPVPTKDDLKAGTYKHLNRLYSQHRVPKPAPPPGTDAWTARTLEAPQLPKDKRPHAELIWQVLAPVVKEYEKRVEMSRSNTVSTKFAMQRLTRDWREVNEHPLPTVAAAPVYENDFLEWHANIMGSAGTPYDGTIFHLTMKFPKSYPHNAPVVKLSTSIPHPNVFGSYICLDMLDESNENDLTMSAASAANMYGGWSSAYSAQSILLQLQAFLMDGSDRYRPIKEGKYPEKERDIEHNKRIDKCLARARHFTCPCQHKHSNPLPPFGRHIRAHAFTPAPHKTVAVTSIVKVSTYSKLTDDDVKRGKKKAVPGAAPVVPDQSKDEKAAALIKADDEKKAAVAAAGPQPSTAGSVLAAQSSRKPTPALPNAAAGAAKLQKAFNKLDAKVNPKGTATPASAATNDTAATPAPADGESGSTDAAPAVTGGKQARPPRKEKPKLWEPPKLSDADSKSLEGRVLTGVVKKVEPYGAFVGVGWRKDGLVHVSKVVNPNGGYLSDVSSVLTVGDVIAVKVMKVDDAKGQLQLSMKDAVATAGSTTTTGAPAAAGTAAAGTTPALKKLAPAVARISLEELKEKEGETIAGTVKGINPSLGVFVDIGATKDGLVRMDSVTAAYQKAGRFIWTPTDIITERQKVRVTVAEVNVEKERVRLELVIDAADVQSVGVDLKAKAEAKADKKSAAYRATVDKERHAVRESLLGRVPDSTFVDILSYVARIDMVRLLRTCRALKRACNEAAVLYWVKQELLCFHTRASFEEDMLGFPFFLEHYDSGELSYSHPSLDLLSRSAFFKQNVRRGVWKEQFTHWLPLYFNGPHSKRLIIHERQIGDMCKNRDSRANNPFHPLMVLKVLPTALNTMIVTMMNGAVHESIKALDGYCALYHLLCSFVVKYPELQEVIDARIGSFIESERNRTKRPCPNLGEWLVLLSVSSYEWVDVAYPYLKENFDRNVKWVVAAYPELVDLQAMWIPPPPPKFDDETIKLLAKYGRKVKPASQMEKEHDAAVAATVQNADRGRLPKTFKATQVSIKLLMFHVYFLTLFRGRNPVDNTRRTVLHAKQMLDKTMGRATPLMQLQFQNAVKKIKKVPDWKGFFEWVGLPNPKEDFLADWLRESCANSARKRYHNPALIKAATAKPRTEAERDAADAVQGKKPKSKKKKIDTSVLDDDMDLDDASMRAVDRATRDFGDY